ncbi:MAG: sporulation protein YunB, partial [Oscillospiraceae bacterium]|nr:sporulation protein YunB [Oscillospiraceae bacterium]
SGRGPGIRFRVVTLGNPSATFTNEFSTAGINQTKHQIMLELTVQVNILVPGRTTRETITTQMLVAETVIVGDVPNVFGQFGF